MKAINNGNLLSWPGIENIKASHLSPKLATAKGHLDQERKNLQSTKIPASILPSLDTPPIKSYECFAMIQDYNTMHRGFSDLTGRFPHTSARGNKYILMVYDSDSNAILSEPLKSKAAGEITRGWKTIYDRLARHGNAPKLFILDNEVSGEFRQALKKYNVDFQLAPPHMHRRNAAERAIRTYKNHFLSVLATADPDFPIAEWDRLLQQTEITLNLLRNSKVNPQLSSYAYLFGNFDFNKTPLAPAGTKVLVHEKPKQRSSWAYHGVDGWYIGPAMEHYRCMKCYIPESFSVRVTDTLQFFPKTVTFPSFSAEDYLQQSATDILTILRSPQSIVPSLQFGDATKNALEHLARLLHRAQRPLLPKLPLTPFKPLPSPPATSPSTTSSQRVPPAPRVEAAAAAHAHQLPRVKKSDFRGTFQHHQNNRGTNYRTTAINHFVAMHVFADPSVNHIYNPDTGKKETMDSLLKGVTSKLWITSLSNELGRLAQGIHGRVVATDTIDFIHRSEVPAGKKVTYANFICDFRPLKSEPYRVRLTVGGDRLPYDNDAGSPAAALLETKLVINSTISDAKKGARFMGADLKDYFLASPMPENEYMRIHSKYFPDDINQHYNIAALVAPDGYVYVRIKKGMYGLKQAALLAYTHLINQLAPHGYRPCPFTTGLWRHDTRPTVFCLCVDDFGIKYFNKSDADHLLSSLQEHYKISVDWEGKNYCGLTLDWNYSKGYVDISMLGYIDKLLDRIKHPRPSKPQYAPHRWTTPAYGQRLQLAPAQDSSPSLDAAGTTYIQSVVGSLLYYSRAVDPTILPALNSIASSQSKPTQLTKSDVSMLLDYCATYPNATIRYYASDMVLHVDSDAAYLVLPNARSRYAGHFYLSNHPPALPQKPNPKPNGPILTECKTIRNIVASAAETETAGVFGNAQQAIVIRRALIELNHPQPPTPLKTDNSTTYGFVHANLRQKKSKTWDMRWNWLRDRSLHQQLNIYWDKGINNDADYFTKHHPPAHHRIQRSRYILKNFHVTNFRLSPQLLTNAILKRLAPSSRTPDARVC